MGDTLLGTIQPAWEQAYNLYQSVRDYRRVAEQAGISYHTARGYVSKYNAAVRNSARAETVAEPIPKMVTEPPRRFSDMPPVAPLQKPYPKRFTDVERWMETADRLNALGRPFTLLTNPDTHFPDHNKPAVYMNLSIAELVKPDVIAWTGDMYDFSAASSFDPSPYEIEPDDILEQVQPHYSWMVGEFSKVCPNADQIVLPGNHDNRRKRSPAYKAFLYTLEAAFVNLVRQDGRAMWIGPKQEIQLDTLFLQHGKRVGESAARNSLKDLGYGVSQVQAHNHTPTWTVIRQRERGWNTSSYRLVTTASTGCLCNIPPHYQDDTDTSRWINGSALIHIYPDAGIANVQQIVFHPYRDGLMAFVGDRVLTV